jgi:predicted nuclease of restriction endonuclease-like RecB superfamily
MKPFETILVKIVTLDTELALKKYNLQNLQHVLNKAQQLLALHVWRPQNSGLCWATRTHGSCRQHPAVG